MDIQENRPMHPGTEQAMKPLREQENASHSFELQRLGVVMEPERGNKEREGIVPNVVFPTAIHRRDDLGLPGRFDVYYGMADNRIGVARLDSPEHAD